MSKPPVKEKDTSLQEKLKKMLGIKNVQPQYDYFMKARPEEYVLSGEMLKEISKDSSVSQRLKGLKRLEEDIGEKYIEITGMEAIWVKIRDLIEPKHQKATRQSVYEFVNFMVLVQYDIGLGMMRDVLFRVIVNREVPEDLNEKLELLNCITNTGRDVEYIEDEIGQFLLDVTENALESSSSLDFLKFLVSVLKFHSAFLDKPVIAHVVRSTCRYTCNTSREDCFMFCLNVLEAIIGYSWVPVECLGIIVATLCRTVNVPAFCTSSLKLARDLLGTHLGHRAFFIMCKILEHPGNRVDSALIRGAVFFTSMCLWGSQRVHSLKLCFSVLLPFLSKVLDGSEAVVAKEVGFSMLRLVSKYGETLYPDTWEFALAIIDDLIKQYFNKPGSHAVSVTESIHQILTSCEKLYHENRYNGCENQLFALIGKCAAKRTDSSVIGLLNFQASLIGPMKSNWLNSLRLLVDTFFKQESRPAIRIRALEVLQHLYTDNHYIYEIFCDDLLEKVILPCLNKLESDTDVNVKKVAVELLLIVAEGCNGKHCMEILAILEKVVLTPIDKSRYPGEKTDETVHVIAENEIIDIKTAVIGLIKLFKTKLHELPSTVFVYVFHILVKHLQLHYDTSIVLRDGGMIRVMVFDCLLRLRADEHRRLGLYDADNEFEYSCYVLCDYSERMAFDCASPSLASPTPLSYLIVSPTYITLESLFKALKLCLQQEKDWSVLKLVLLELPKILQNRTLLMTCPTSIMELCQSVCSLISDKNLQLPETLRNAPVTLSRPEFHMHVYPIQIAFVSYHKYLDETVQKLLVTSLKCGLTTKCAPTCISALSICLLEMNTIMSKLTPYFLLSLSKISATPPLANSVLQFLAILIRFPNLYASFVHEQYMSIFATAMPYTNPFRFHHFTVSLAHHVIAMWFMKCRIAYRRDFVKFIVKGLRNNILLPLKEGSTSEDRTRKEQDRPPGQFRYSAEVLTTFHRELTETCIDLLTRYTFAGCSAVPKRGPLAEFLLILGQSATWIIGNKVITITTSGCTNKANPHGLCEKCFSVCKKATDDSNQEPFTGMSENIRRRHRSAAVRRSLSIDSQEKVPRAKDDLQILTRTRDDLPVYCNERLQTTENEKKGTSETEPTICSCWCQEWAEILVRRPTGNTSWLIRIQNELHPSDIVTDFPLSEISNMIVSCYQLRHKKKPVTKFGHERIDSEGLDEREFDELIRDLIPDIDAEEESGGTLSCSEESKEMPDNDTKTKESLNVDQENPTADLAAEKRVNDPPTTEQPVVKKSDNPDVKMALDSAQCIEIKPEVKTDLTVKTDHPVGSGVKPKRIIPIRLPDVRERQMHSPIYNLASAPLSPLPLQNFPVYEEMQPVARDRCNTIAVMSPVRPKLFPGTSDPNQHIQETPQQSINPNFVFMQLYYSYQFGDHATRPVYFPKSELSDRALKVLDHIPPYDTYKIGVLYIGPNQADSETEILANEYGSVRYINFLHTLGDLVELKRVNPRQTYVGGLDLTGPDGKFTYIWKDDVLQVVFHVSTLMPTKKNDPLCNEKKRHIGNDFVSIVYNNSGKDYNIHTIKGQFIYACVVIQPLDCDNNLVIIKAKPELASLLGVCDSKIVSDNNLAILVRQLALYANLAALVLQRQQRSNNDPYASNWLERQRNIKRMREKRMAETPPPRDDDSPPGRRDASGCTAHNMDDFTKFV